MNGYLKVSQQEPQRPNPQSESLSVGGGSSPPTPELSIRAGICGDHYCTAVFVRTQVLVIDQFNDPRVKERGLNH